MSITETRTSEQQGFHPIPGGLDEIAGAAALQIAGMSALSRGGLYLDGTELAIVLALLMRAKEEAAAAAAQVGGGGAERQPLPVDKAALEQRLKKYGYNEEVGDDVVDALKRIKDKDLKALLEMARDKSGIQDVTALKIRMPIGAKYLEGEYAIKALKGLEAKDVMTLVARINKEVVPEGSTAKVVLLYQKNDGTYTGIRDNANLSKPVSIAIPKELLMNREFVEKLSKLIEKNTQLMQPSSERGGRRT